LNFIIFLVHHNYVEEMFFYEKEMAIIYGFKDLIGVVVRELFGVE
jgi:hypothetical protein